MISDFIFLIYFIKHLFLIFINTHSIFRHIGAKPEKPEMKKIEVLKKVVASYWRPATFSLYIFRGATQLLPFYRTLKPREVPKRVTQPFQIQSHSPICPVRCWPVSPPLPLAVIYLRECIVVMIYSEIGSHFEFSSLHSLFIICT